MTAVRFDASPAFTFAEPDPAGPLILTAERALPWDVEVRANGWGDMISFAPGSVNAAELDCSRVKLLLDHRPKPFGYGVAATDDGAGLGLRMAIPREELDDPEVAAAVRQMRNGVRDAVSVGVDLLEFSSEPIDPDDRSFMAAERIRVTGAELLELSSVIVPRFAEARHRPLAASHTGGAPPMPTITANTPLEPDAPPVEPPDEPDPDEVRLTAHRLSVLELAAGVHMHRPSPFAAFASLGHYAQARYADKAGRLPDLEAVWVDQLTVDSPGVMQPTWVSDIKGIVAAARPFVTGLGGPASAGATDLVLSWPYIDVDITTLVAKQAAEKTEIHSVKVPIKRATATLDTYAGGSDLALQLVERSSPSYLDAYLRIMAAGFAATTDAAAVAQAVAASTDYVVVDLAAATADVIAGAVFEASLKVQRATGSPATVVAVADDVFPKVAAAIMSVSAPSGNTAAGAASASTLNVSLAGLSVIADPYLAAGTGLVTNRNAYTWAEDGPRTISALDVPRLGNDVAIYGYGIGTPFAPAGIVELLAVAPVVAGASSRKAKD